MLDLLYKHYHHDTMSWFRKTRFKHAAVLSDLFISVMYVQPGSAHHLIHGWVLQFHLHKWKDKLMLTAFYLSAGKIPTILHPVTKLIQMTNAHSLSDKQLKCRNDLLVYPGGNRQMDKEVKDVASIFLNSRCFINRQESNTPAAQLFCPSSL